MDNIIEELARLECEEAYDPETDMVWIIPQVTRELDLIIRDVKQRNNNYQYRGTTMIQQMRLQGKL
jgi:chorismate mutase